MFNAQYKLNLWTLLWWSVTFKSYIPTWHVLHVEILPMLSRYRWMSESVQHEKQWSWFKEYPNFGSREKNEEIISINSHPHLNRASSFTNKHKAARLICSLCCRDIDEWVKACSMKSSGRDSKNTQISGAEKKMNK